MAAAMGFSSHTSAPFRPYPSSFAPPYFWFSRSCPHSFSTSRLFWSSISSRKSLNRHEACETLSANVPFSNGPVSDDSLEKISNRKTRQHGASNMCDDGKSICGSSQLKFVVNSVSPNPTSSTHISPTCQLPGARKLFSTGYQNQWSDEDIPHDFIHYETWNDQTKALKRRKEDYSLTCLQDDSDYQTSQQGTSNDLSQLLPSNSTDLLMKAPYAAPSSRCQTQQNFGNGNSRTTVKPEPKYCNAPNPRYRPSKPTSPENRHMRSVGGFRGQVYKYVQRPGSGPPRNINGWESPQKQLSKENSQPNGSLSESRLENGYMSSAGGFRDQGYKYGQRSGSGPPRNINGWKSPQKQLPEGHSQPNGFLAGSSLEGQKEKCSIVDKESGSYETERLTTAEKSLHSDKVNEADSQKIMLELEKVRQSELRNKLGLVYEKVLVVDNIDAAKAVVAMLTNQYKHLVHACDTEVAKIDVKQETPVDHGEVICFSIYSGPEVNFGNGKSCLWIDVLGGGGENLMKEFEPFFKDTSIKKVWHNYSFDSHVIENYGFKVGGFHADTMHMARLWNSSRRTEGGYSLESLTGDSFVMSDARLCPGEELIGKVSMKTIFGKKKVKKDGSEGKVITIPSVEELQTVERKLWICYSALDSISTLRLYESLKTKLSNMEWKLDGVKKGSMFNFYEKYWRPFGELLVRMEREGMLVDCAYLAEMEKVAKAEQQIATDRFRDWASKYCPDAKYMNVGSDAQLRQLFFGGIQNRKKQDESLEVERTFKVPNIDKVIEEGKKAPTKFRTIKLHRIFDNHLKTDIHTASGWPSVSGNALKALAGKVSEEFDFIADADQSDSIDGVQEMEEGSLSGDQHKTAYSDVEGQQGIEASHAIAALCEVCSVDSLISNFLVPLQGTNIAGKNGRVHCSLNINTETGRLSARRPNLQNQPALEKDRYKIRQAFIAAPGNSLIVADYGQLELRILAHLANCKSMLDAFKAGGDFHSRTAMNMYPHIRDAIEQKRVLLEWDPQPGEDKPPVPLLKDAFASERRKAKMLNFSIAYGKTAVGLSRDWKVSVEEARKTVDLWYSDRKEVLSWQEQRKAEARQYGCVQTLLGRARRFPSHKTATHMQKGHIERAAINTPVQGSAADVAMCAMLKISEDPHLKALGWKLLMQVHDEVILEGPTESAEEAKKIVVECMSRPFDGKYSLKVDLSVDAKCAQNWYAAK